MKVIFLDVDGELTYSDYRNPSTANIDVEKVKLLKQICDATDAKVVISSSWRGGPGFYPVIYFILREILEDCGIDVIGDTPFVPTTVDPYYSDIISLDDISEEFHVKFGTGRAEEIHRWIKENNPEAFVILDDEEWNWKDYGYDKYWIQPTWYGDGGLKPEHVERAIRILNGE